MKDIGSNQSISVVMATYNGALYITEQLDSILSQTVLPTEIIIVDDCSTDATLDILEDYAERYPIIKVFRNEHNLGAHQNFRKAFSLSRGAYIAPSDQDDVWRADKLEVLKELLVENDVELAYSQEEILWENGETSKAIQDMPDMRNLMWGNNLKGHTFLFKRELLEVFETAKDLSFDYALAMKACMTGRHIASQEALSVWRRHDGVCTTAISASPELKGVSVSRWRKIRYAFVHLSKEKSIPIEESFSDRARILSKDSKTARYSKVCRGVAKQTHWSMLKASVNNAIIQNYEGGFAEKLAHCMWAMRQPWVYWYDMRCLHALE